MYVCCSCRTALCFNFNRRVIEDMYVTSILIFCVVVGTRIDVCTIVESNR